MSLLKPTKKIYVFSLKEITGESEAIALGDCGRVITHSRYINEADIPYDFGVRGLNNKNCHDKYDDFAPDGWTIEFVQEKQIPKNKELQKALKIFADSDTIEDTEEENESES